MKVVVDNTNVTNVFFLRKRHSMNPTMFKGLEHPSGFPSMLRGSTPTPTHDTRHTSNLHRKDSHGSTSHLRRHDSNGVSSSTRRDSSNTDSLKRRDSFGSGLLHRKESTGSSIIGRRDSTDTKTPSHTKRDSLTDDFRRMSFGSGIYMRPDSSGETNLIHRDAVHRKDSSDTGRRTPRDYVSLKSLEPKTFVHDDNCELAHSILRKGDDTQTNKENVEHKLTSANLSKHVTILDEHLKDETDGGGGGRRDSSGSFASRRMSIDSLDARRRGSSASAADLGFSFDSEVSCL